MNKDTVTGIVGAVLLVAAMVGVFIYERSNGAGAYDVTWETATGDGASASGSAAVGASSEGTITLDQGNLDDVTFTLAWSGQGPNDNVRFTVSGPGGLTAEPVEGTGPWTIPFADLNPEPTVETVVAGTEEEARADLDEGAGQGGVGDWTVTVEYVDPGVPAALPLSGDWEVSSSLAWYEPTLS